MSTDAADLAIKPTVTPQGRALAARFHTLRRINLSKMDSSKCQTGKYQVRCANGVWWPASETETASIAVFLHRSRNHPRQLADDEVYQTQHHLIRQGFIADFVEGHPRLGLITQWFEGEFETPFPTAKELREKEGFASENVTVNTIISAIKAAMAQGENRCTLDFRLRQTAIIQLMVSHYKVGWDDDITTITWRRGINFAN